MLTLKVPKTWPPNLANICNAYQVTDCQKIDIFQN